MIYFKDFLPVPAPARTKVKFNIRDGAGGVPAWDLLLQDDQEPWLNMTRYRAERNSNNNLDEADYVLAFAQYPLYGPNFFVGSDARTGDRCHQLLHQTLLLAR